MNLNVPRVTWKAHGVSQSKIQPIPLTLLTQNIKQAIGKRSILFPQNGSNESARAYIFTKHHFVTNMMQKGKCDIVATLTPKDAYTLNIDSNK